MLSIGDKGSTRVYQIHRDLVTMYSPVIKRLLDQNEDQKTSLPDIKARLFEDFISWLYTGSWVNNLTANEGQTEGRRQTKDAILIAELWYLGEALECVSFQNHCIDLMREKFHGREKKHICPLSISSTADLLAFSPPNSLLAKFIAHAIAWFEPFSEDVESEDYEQSWNELLDRFATFARELLWAGGIKWDGCRPWMCARGTDILLQQQKGTPSYRAGERRFWRLNQRMRSKRARIRISQQLA